MKTHGWLLIFSGAAVALAPFVLIGIGIVRDYRAGRPNRASEPHNPEPSEPDTAGPSQPHNARNIVLGFAVAIVATVIFAQLSHRPQTLTAGPVHPAGAHGVPFVPVPLSVAAPAPRAASVGAPVAAPPKTSTTTTFAVRRSGLVTALVSTLVKGTTLKTAPTASPGGAVVTTAKPPITTATTTKGTTTKGTVATTTTTRGATTTSTTLPPTTTTTVAATTTTVPVTTTTATTVPVTTTTATTVPVTTTTVGP